MATKTVTFEELKQHSKKDDLYVLISGKGANGTTLKIRGWSDTYRLQYTM
jgi:hypothetical protein